VTALAEILPDTAPPHSEESERAVLGALLIEPLALPTLSGRLQSEDFYTERNRIVYAAMLQLQEAGIEIDLRTLQAQLEQEGRLEDVGGVAYLASLDLDLPDIGRLDSYVEIVKERSVRRRLISTCRSVIRDCQDGGSVIQDALDTAEGTIADLRGEISLASDPRALEIEDFLALDVPIREPLISGLLHRQDLAMVYSWRGIGKTHFAIGLACSLACGENLLRWDVESPVGVLYVDGEMPVGALQQRFAAALAGTGARDLKAPLRIFAADLEESGLNLATPRVQAAVESQLEGVGVVVIDNLSTLFPCGDENLAGDWEIAQRWILKLRRRGIAVVLLHHSGKGGQQRGTSRREDVLDVVLNLRRPSNYRADEGCRFEIYFEKARSLHADDVRPFEAALTTDEEGRATWLIRNVKSNHAGEINELVREGLSQRQIANELGLNQSTVCRTLKKAAQQ
jgi:KaiC/GvpD/RAD55 family RecA-like ATPase